MAKSTPHFAHPHQAYTAGFYRDADWDFEVRNVLGRACHGASDVGETLQVISAVDEGDHEGWFAAWMGLGTRSVSLADSCAAEGHRISAAAAYLRAATYFAVAVNAVDGLAPDSRRHGARNRDTTQASVFRKHRAAWDRFVATTAVPVEPVRIPYEDTTLPGYFFSGRAAGTPPRALPTLILVNGSDGALSGLWADAGVGAVERGYNVLVFDGPGQQSMLFEHGMPFRPDWEAVVTPVVDFVVARADVDAARIALYGISQGGFWVPRALAFEHRVAAAIVDPGVVDVSASWTARVPASLLKLLHKGNAKAFNRDMKIGLAVSAGAARTWAFRARPYGKEGYFDTLIEVLQYNLSDVASAITTPIFITNPDGEQFWPGQSQALAGLVSGPAVVSNFTTEEGARLHCQPLARALTDQRMFDWLDNILAPSESTSVTVPGDTNAGTHLTGQLLEGRVDVTPQRAH